MAEPTTDINRLRHAYRQREDRLAEDARYTLSDPAHLYTTQQRQRHTIALLQQVGFNSFPSARILDLGCGRGGDLLSLLTLGCRPDRLHGADLLLSRLQAGRRRLPFLALACADGQALPYPHNAFDLILQNTVFTSILDTAVKTRVAAEMRRVLAPRGLILWYDFWLNPTNKQTRGIRPAEIRRLFPGCRFTFRRLTLAPPLARRLVPLSWTLCLLLEKLKLFNTHYLVAIQPE